AASPITRMCGARESDRRRPSRTTSWSSTIRQVISAGVSKGPGSLVSALDGQQKLFGLGELLAVQLLPPAVADAVFVRQSRHLREARSLCKDVEVTDDHRAARDDRERVVRVTQRLEARARELVAALGRLVRISRGAERDELALPRRPRQLAAQHVGDVHLDA